MTKKIKEDEMGSACGMYGVKYEQRLSVGKPEGMRRLGTACTSERVILKWMTQEAGWELMDWCILAQDRSQWRTFVHTVMNYIFHITL